MHATPSYSILNKQWLWQVSKHLSLEVNMSFNPMMSAYFSEELPVEFFSEILTI